MWTPTQTQTDTHTHVHPPTHTRILEKLRTGGSKIETRGGEKNIKKIHDAWVGPQDGSHVAVHPTGGRHTPGRAPAGGVPTAPIR